MDTDAGTHHQEWQQGELSWIQQREMFELAMGPDWVRWYRWRQKLEKWLLPIGILAGTFLGYEIGHMVAALLGDDLGLGGTMFSVGVGAFAGLWGIARFFWVSDEDYHERERVWLAARKKALQEA